MRVLLCLISLLQSSFGGSGILLEPLPGKSGPTKILVYVHGAFVNESHYVTMCRSIQAATPLTLWVGLPYFILDTPNPGTINGAVTGMVSRIVKQGSLATTAADVFVAGHSLGGVFAPAVVNKYKYAGLLEFGSYVTQGLDIRTVPFPVLTLGGELDGLTRATRIAVEFEKMSSLPPAEQLRKPVALLPGVSHSQFCEGVNVTSFGNYDLVPAVTWEAAHAAISAAAADFLALATNVSPGAVADAKHAFAERFAYTEKLTRGFLAARQQEAAAQPVSVPGAAALAKDMLTGNLGQPKLLPIAKTFQRGATEGKCETVDLPGGFPQPLGFICEGAAKNLKWMCEKTPGCYWCPHCTETSLDAVETDPPGNLGANNHGIMAPPAKNNTHARDPTERAEASAARTGVPPPRCQSDLCETCIITAQPHGSCCNTSWSCVFDTVFQENICLPPTPWICAAEHRRPGLESARARQLVEQETPPPSEENWCATAQRSSVAPASAGREYNISVDVVHNAATLAVSYPSISGASPAAVKLVSYASYGLNPIDISTVPVAATSLTCEMISADAIDAANKAPGAGGKTPAANLCQAANDEAIAAAKALVTPSTLQRWAAVGVPVQTAADKRTSTGPGFLASSLGWDVSDSGVRVTGVSLATKTDALAFPGVYQCVLLSPAKMIEWMMVDGLPKLGKAPCSVC